MKNIICFFSLLNTTGELPLSIFEIVYVKKNIWLSRLGVCKDKSKIKSF